MAAIDAPPPALPPTMLAAMGDDTLVGLIAAGSDDAFAALDERYRRRLVRFTRGFVPGGTADAEDAVQEAMVRAVRALRGGSRPEAVGPWLHRIARNCALDLTASRRRHPVVELADHAHPAAEDAAATAERRMGMRGLVSDVGRLPASQRSALVLRELEGRSYADIADELDVTVPAVKSLLVRARQGLRRAHAEGRAAALVPVSLLTRLAERLGSLWEPVSGAATPKVATVAAVMAGSIPALAPSLPSPVPMPKPRHHVAPAPAQARPAAVTTAPATTATAPTGGTPAPANGPDSAAALHADCADGTIDSTFSHAALLRGLRHLDQSAGEYGDCSRAIRQALL
ncbi:sigma-70 family RNA polymerase sigma factor [Baekduia soli]|uniref:Sigma-70 family RNA polymerase sigma factor n=1 Tax=Baekduia soli TaxID=496014 RepID=A0A5B8UBP0_9ACTN|nr:sigma-70 family RNA polymerase sigma factor [Baekduia soli]QEC50460.1 sigma-70 family RNA polymerase sigma factor [Baekduia soli]